MSKHATRSRAPHATANARSIAIQSAARCAEEAFENEETDEALAILAEAEATWPQDPTIACLIGKFTAEKKSSADGIRKLESVLERHPAHLPTLLELGNVHLKPGNMVKANPYVQKSVEIAPKHPAPRCAMGSLQQRLGNLPEAVEQYRTALKLQLKQSVCRQTPPKKKADFRVKDAETLLWKTLALMADSGIHMFAAFGTLLGLTRNRGLLAHDKDIDTGIPYSEMSRAIAILQRHGWRESNRSFGLMNPRAMFNKEAGISLDISGFVIDKDNGKALTAGAWIPGLPKDWNMIFEFDRIELQKLPVPDGSGSAWCMKNPEAWLESIYGNWRVPDKMFDTMVAARNVRQFSLLARCFAYARIFEHWSKNNTSKALALARHTLLRDPSDALIQNVVSRLNH
jgi:tetratricopeptide (TPR) repeat protein